MFFWKVEDLGGGGGARGAQAGAGGKGASAASDAWAAWPLHDVPRIALDSENAATDFQYYLSWGPFCQFLGENFPISDGHFSHTSTGKKGVLVFGD